MINGGWIISKANMKSKLSALQMKKIYKFAEIPITIWTHGQNKLVGFAMG